MPTNKQTSMVIPEARDKVRTEFILDFSKYKITLPQAGVFDEPRRCYPLNNEWAKIFMGFLDTLTDPRLWTDAEDETYLGIQALLEFMRGEDCMDCQDVEDCLDTSQTIINITETINNNNVSIDVDNTTVNNVFPPSEQANTVGGSPPAPTPPDDCNFDAVWSACNQLVQYIDAQNRDFLQEITQVANLAQQASRAVSALPLLGLLPLDEVLGYVGFLVDELLAEYNAIVDTALLQEVACDLFCIAIDNDPCGLLFSDAIDYFSGKVPPSLGQAVDTFANLVQFAITGTFQGDDYFYYISYFQLWVAYAGQEFLGLRGVTQYGLQAAAGYNSPDADWQLFCSECVPQNCIEYDFTLQDWGFTVWSTGNRPYGTYVSGVGWKAQWSNISGDTDNRVYIEKINMLNAWNITNIEVDYTSNEFNAGGQGSIRATIGTANQFATVFPDEYIADGLEHQVATVHEDNGIDGFRVSFTTNTNAANPDAFVIKRIRIFYSGEQAPEGGNPC